MQAHRSHGPGIRARVVRRAAVALLLALVPGPACDRAHVPASAEVPVGPTLRLLEPSAGQVSMADVARAEVAGETRPVLDAPRTRMLRWREAVVLDDAPIVRVDVDPEVATGGRGSALVDAWISAPDPSTRGRSARDLRVAEGVRHRLAAPPRVVGAEARGPVSLEIPIPEAFRELAVWLNVLATRLPAAQVAGHTLGPLTVRPGDRLVFGFAIAEPAWHADLPPVAFRVFVEPAGADDGGREGEGGGAGGRAADRQQIFERRIDPARDVRDRRYLDASVSLDAYSGQRVQIVIEHEVLETGDPESPTAERVRASLPLIANPMVVGARPPDRPRRNLILISLDTLRASSVGSYGYARDTTPSLDRRIARAGAVLEQAIAPIPFTPPSHMTMLTGLAPCVHGVRTRHDVLSDERPTLAEMLRAAGYRTAAFTEDAYVVAGSGFARGFDVYAEERDEESASPGFAAETFARAERWLESRDAAPFFLFIHTYQVHEPYTPPRSYSGLFRDDDPVPPVPARYRAARDDYDREIRQTDDVLAAFLDTLDRRGLVDDTLLVVTSDHGEAFGEHFWTGHGASLNEEAVRVPLLLRAPGLIAPGIRIAEPVALMDLVPTLLELLRVAPAAPTMGRSFASRVTGGDTTLPDRPLVLGAIALEGVRTDRYKFLRMRPVDPKGGEPAIGREGLFDLTVDPDERVDVLGREPALAEEARAALAAHAAACDRFMAENPATPAGERRDGDDPGWMVHRDDIDAKLRSLGYIE